MRGTSKGRGVDVVYVGFLLGHGGDALQMLALADGMQRRNARVRVVVPENEHTLTFQHRCDAVGLECTRTRLIAADMAGSPQRLRSVVQLLAGVDAHILHLHTGNSCLPRSVMLALELKRHPAAFVTLQSPYETIEPGSLRARLWAATARRRMRAVVSPSEHGTRFQVRCGVPAQQAVTIRNSVDLARIARGRGNVARASLGAGPDDPIVLFSSRLDGQKRPLDALRIFAGVAAAFPRALLVFVGSGREEDALKAEVVRLRLERQVRLVGYQRNVEDWLAAATVWLLPTERENFSLAVLEALAAGCAVLSTSCPGNDEILVEGSNALTFGVGDVESGRRALRRLLAEDSLRDVLRKGAIASSEKYSVERMVEAYRTLYDSSGVA